MARMTASSSSAVGVVVEETLEEAGAGAGGGGGGGGGASAVLEDAFPVLGLLYFQKSSSELFLDCESSALYRYPSHTK